MQVSRRAFGRSLVGGGGLGARAVFVSARGYEAMVAELGAAADPAALYNGRDLVQIDSNENPLGPGPAAVEAILKAFEDAGRYPVNARQGVAQLRAAIAKKFSVKDESVVIGAGSREILRNAIMAFTSPSRPLVTAKPSFEQPAELADQIGVPVKAVPVDKSMRIDLEATAAAAKGAGLVFFCNPNNPTSTVHSASAVADFVARVRKESPDTLILIDEAYHDYVTDPSYATAAELAMREPNVFIARTFSKAYGMAGLRSGYAVGQTKTLEAMARWAMIFNQTSLGTAAAVASLGNPEWIAKERARNTEARLYTRRFFEKAGYTVADSQANFLFVDVRRPAKEVREACKKQKVLVGRDFPPFEKSHLRVSIGTMDEMRKATEVLGQVLGVSAKDTVI